MKPASRRIFALALGLAVVISCGESPTPTFDNPFDPRNGQGLPIPDSLVVTVGNNEVRICWGLPDDTTADEFAVFRQRLDISEAEALVKRLTERCYTDTGVRNGKTYAYRIAAGREGRFGTRSEAIEARPGIFSIVINDDAPKTRNRAVAVTVTAPSAETVRLSEDPDSVATAPERRATTSLSWTLSPGDGPKELFAIIRLPDGSESLPVSDTIVLDTQARIASVDFDGPETRHPGETLHFKLAAGETGGNASVTVTGLVTTLPLFDDGSMGDAAAADSVYERDWVIPAGSAVTSAAVTGQFTDDIGNVAATLTASRSLTVVPIPDPVQFVKPALVAHPPDAAAVTLRWTRSQATDFSAYQIFRSETAPVDSTSRLVRSETARTTLEFTDRDVVEGHGYFYRVYVLTASSYQVGSDTLHVVLPNERPPAQVSLGQAAAIGETSLSLSWGRSADTDFEAYLLCRNETGAVSPADTLVRITDVNQNYWQETGLTPGTKYYYVVYVEDEGGKLSPPSAQITATTEPAGVALVSVTPASPPDPAAVTLRWTQASATEFSAYQVFRAGTTPVDSASSFVGSVPGRSTLEFTDSTVVEGRQYCYRLYVLTTTGSQRGSTNTLCVVVSNDRYPREVTLEEAAGVGQTNLSLRWSPSLDRDFAAYAVYRNETGTVTDADSLVARITNANLNYWDEFGLVPGTKYHYRIYVEDQGDLTSRSNEISATTLTASTTAGSNGTKRKDTVGMRSDAPRR